MVDIYGEHKAQRTTERQLSEALQLKVWLAPFLHPDMVMIAAPLLAFSSSPAHHSSK